MKVTMKIPIEPMPAPRPRFGKFGAAYMPRVYQLFKREIANEGLKVMSGAPPMEGALEVNVKFYCTKYKTITGKKSGDLDNHAKTVFDALNRIVYDDDSQIVKCSIAKYHSETPCIEIEIKTIDDVDDQ